MKNLGIIRKTDELGRVVIPSEIRKEGGWSEKQPLEVLVDGDCVVLRPYNSNKNASLIRQLRTLISATDNLAVIRQYEGAIHYLESEVGK